MLVDRLARHLGVEVVTTPVGFKWIYEEMVKGGVLIGGEESGGIGIPSHVRERDGLLMALLLAEMMAQRGQGLGELVDDLIAITGPDGVRPRRPQARPRRVKDAFVASWPTLAPDRGRGLEVREIVRADGIKFLLARRRVAAHARVRHRAARPRLRRGTDAAEWSTCCSPPVAPWPSG